MSKIDTIVELGRTIYDKETLSNMLDILIASLLFVELENVSEFYGNSAVTVELLVRCRLPESTALVHMTNLYYRKCRLYYSAD